MGSIATTALFCPGKPPYLLPMPFDPVPQSPPDDPALRRQHRQVAAWLFGMCGLTLAMVTLGGVTRLTGSGLSIMEWAPIMGALPPTSDAEWHRLFGLYQRIPQYHLVNAGFGLEGFKHIFWLEWAHRLLGRVVGLAYAVPLAVFLWRGAIPRGMRARLVGLFLLLGTQGAVGWFMVSSGFFADTTSVEAWRLVLHLTLALALFAAMLWSGLSLLRPLRLRVWTGPARLFAATAASVALTIVAGGFVAGLHAGLTYNTFPLMDGHLVPPGYAALTPFARNLVANVGAAQFDHRLLATLTAALTLCAVVAGVREARRDTLRRRAAVALGLAVAAQYALGVATLVNMVPTGLASLHQFNAVLVLAAALVSLHLSRSRAVAVVPARYAAPAVAPVRRKILFPSRSQ